MFSLYTDSPYYLAGLEAYHQENKYIVSAEIPLKRPICILVHYSNFWNALVDILARFYTSVKKLHQVP